MALPGARLAYKANCRRSQNQGRSVTFAPTGIKLPHLAKGIALHAYYFLADSYHLVADRLESIKLEHFPIDLSQLKIKFSQPALPEGGLYSNESFTMGSAQGRSRRSVSVAEAVKGLIRQFTNKEIFYPSSVLLQRLKDDCRANVGEKEFTSAVEFLVAQKRIEINQDGELRYYNQAAAIKEASSALSRALDDKDLTLDNLAKIVGSATAPLFRNFDLYFVDGSSETRLGLIVSGDRDGSMYQKWRPLDKTGIFEAMFSSQRERDRFKHCRDIKAEVSARSITRNQERYHDPKEAIYCVQTLGGSSKDGVAVEINEWQPKSEKETLNRSLYSLNVVGVSSREEVGQAIKGFLVAIAGGLERVMARHTGMTVQQVWEMEEESRPLQSAMVIAPSEVESLLSYLKSSASLGVRTKTVKRNGRKFLDITVDDPAKILGQDTSDLVLVLNKIWPGLREAFIETVVRRSTKLKLKFELTKQGKVPVGYHMVTKKDAGRGTYFEVFAMQDNAQKLGFTTSDTFDFVKEAFAEEATDRIEPKLKWGRSIRVEIKLLLAFCYARGWLKWLIKQPPKEFNEVKARIAFLTDTSVGVGPFLPIMDRFSPKLEKTKFEPSAADLKAVLPDGYEPIRVEVDGIPAYVVESHEARQAGQAPKHKDEKVEEFVRKALDPTLHPELDNDKKYDLVVFFDATIEDFKKFFDQLKARRKLKKTTRKVLGRINTFA